MICKHLKIIPGLEAAFRFKQSYNIERNFFIPPFWVKKTLRLIQAFFQTPESEEAGLSLVAKQVDEGGFGGMGLSLINYYAKKNKSAPYLYGMFGPCWAIVISWGKESSKHVCTSYR